MSGTAMPQSWENEKLRAHVDTENFWVIFTRRLGMRTKKNKPK